MSFQFWYRSLEIFGASQRVRLLFNRSMFRNCSDSDIFLGYKFRISPFPPPSLPWLHDFVISLILNLTPVYLPLATIGNVLSIAVFRRSNMTFISNGFILIAFTDLLVLYIYMLPLYLNFGRYIDSCRVLIFFMNIWIQKCFLTFGHWLLVLVSIEQSVVIFRSKNRKISGCRICCLYISLMIFTSFINLPYFFMGLLHDPVLVRFYNFMNTFDSILTGAVPFVIMFGVDITILTKMCARKRSKQKRRKRKKRDRENEEGKLSTNDIKTNEENNGELDERKRKNVKDAHGHETADHSRTFEGAIVIMALNVAAIFFDIPNSAANFLRANNNDIINATLLLIFTRHTFNFLFYFSSFYFRQEFLKLLCCCRYHSLSRNSPLKTTPLQTITGRLSV